VSSSGGVRRYYPFGFVLSQTSPFASLNAAQRNPSIRIDLPISVKYCQCSDDDTCRLDEWRLRPNWASSSREYYHRVALQSDMFRLCAAPTRWRQRASGMPLRRVGHTLRTTSRRARLYVALFVRLCFRQQWTRRSACTPSPIPRSMVR